MGTEMNIGDFAALTGLSISAVRFYGDRGLLPPARVDPTTGYRLYSQEQVDSGELIRDLRRINMSLADIERALTLNNAERQALVHHHLQSLEEELRRVTALAERLGGVQSSSTRSTMEKTVMPETTLAAGDIAAALDQVLPAAGVDQNRPDLMTVLVEATEGSIRFVATDSHRCAIRDLVPTSLDGDFSAVLPAATMRDWQGQLEGPATVTLQRRKGKLAATGDGINLQASVLQMTFPPYKNVLSSSANRATTIMTTRSDLLEALAAFDGDGPVDIDAATDRVTIGDGHTSQTIDASCDSPTSIAVNPSFAADAVRHAVGLEVVIEIDGPLDLLVFRSADDGTYTSLLMPVKQDR